MRKALLLKYIQAEASEAQKQEVLNWIDKSIQNKEYFLTLKNTWISQNMPSDMATQAELQNIRLALKQSKQAKRNIYKLLTILSSAVAAVAIIILLIRPSESSIRQQYKNELLAVKMKELPKEFKRTIYTEKGVKGFVILPDSSRVWLNSDTKISFPITFIGSTREVELDGEAYFSVVKDSIKPMIVNIPTGLKIKVLGTEFNLKSYSADNTVIASLYSGKIELLYNSILNTQEVQKILPNEQVEIFNDIIKISEPKQIKDNYAWKDGQLIFDSAKLRNVIKELERWHGIDIIVKDDKIMDYTISATFNSESIIQIMDMIKYCILVDYKFENNKIYIFERKV